jgi:cell division protein ZapA (FtsZ GTPase activity inhibitor)
MTENSRSIVTVSIAGEEYTIRAYASPEYTLRCAEHVDQTIAQILSRSALIEAQKIGILAALSVTNQLFEARAELAALRAEMDRAAARLADDVDAAARGDLASSR